MAGRPRELGGSGSLKRTGGLRATVRRVASTLGLVAGLVAGVLGCGSPRPAQENDAGAAADLIFVGEHILTMDPLSRDPDPPDVGGVAVRDGTLVVVGTREEALTLQGPETRIVELGEHALLPGLIDAHGHFTFTARTIDFVNVASPPVGTAEKLDDVVQLLRDRLEERDPPAGEWIVGYGYDDSLLAERRHPERTDLDRVSTEHPIVLLHVSGHLAAVSSAALEALGLDASSEDPPGGVIRRQVDGREPSGVLEETAATAVLVELGSLMTSERFEQLVRRAAMYYASYGITTAQDGAASPADIESLRAINAKESLPIDLVAYPHVRLLPSLDEVEIDGEPVDGVRVAGVKFTLDGSPQGRTAWLTEPYAEGPPGRPADYRAYPTHDPDEFREQAASLLGRGIPFLVHANGDAAIDLVIDGVAKALEGRSELPDHRTVVIHAQLMRADQLDRAKELGLIPSFFAAHPFYWGDWHRRSFGDERAQNISPIGWAREREVPFTLHNDAPIVPPDMMRLLWIATNRTTRSGAVLGPDQRATVMEALHAMTLGAAQQSFEEDRKGSITVGKQADLVVLSADPRAVDSGELPDLEVIETFARGESVYRADEGSVRNRGEGKEQWWDALPRPAWSAFERIPVAQDWFEVYRAAEGVFAIYEPGQFEEVISYLIVGSERALLFDTGLGIGDLRAVVAELTELPIVVLASHTHYDHVGGHHQFDQVWGVDSEYSRESARGRSHEQVAEFVGEGWIWKPTPPGFEADEYVGRPFEIDATVDDGQLIDLGGRQLEVLLTPGHAPDALCLLDRERRLLFTGDTYYPAPLYAHLEGSDFGLYRATARRLAMLQPEVDHLLPGHNEPLVGSPVLLDVHRAFEAIATGEADFVISDGNREYGFDGFSVITRDPPESRRER